MTKGRWIRFLRRPVTGIISAVPDTWKRRIVMGIRRRMRNQYTAPEEEIAVEAEEFFLGECLLVFWGLIILLFLAAVMLVVQNIRKDELIFERNGFGEGRKEIAVILKKGEQEQSHHLILEEQELSEEQEQAFRRKFFQKLEAEVAGENQSLKKVRTSLHFVESVDGWPFTIVYEPENPEYILLDGSLGEIKGALERRGKIETEVQVTAGYGNYLWKKRLTVQIFPAEKKKQDSPFTVVKQFMKKQEKATRKSHTYVVPGQKGDVQVEKAEDFSMAGLFLSGMVLWICLPVHRILKLREGEKKCRQETLRDFPVLVHRLTLYMGAGLSLASAIHRMGEDYKKRPGGRRSYAFEELLKMDRQVMLGAGQQEACLQWGKRFQEPVYRKMSMTLIQVLSKGTREGRILLEQMEQEAFYQRIAQAKKEGEEASTRLLFPMIVLLCLVMIVVMFPAVMRFQGF